MKLFDLHCDTPYEIAHKRVPLAKNDLHISHDKTAPYTAYIQSAAVWSDCRLSDEDAWGEYLRISEHFAREVVSTPRAILGRTAEDLRRADGMRAILRSKCSHNGTFRQGAPFVGVERVKHDPNLYYTTNC